MENGCVQWKLPDAGLADPGGGGRFKEQVPACFLPTQRLLLLTSPAIPPEPGHLCPEGGRRGIVCLPSIRVQPAACRGGQGYIVELCCFHH